MYWLHDSVWPFPQGQVQHKCVQCVEKKIGRKLTLHDLSMVTQKRSLAHNSVDFVRKYARATVWGACQAASVDAPTNWAPTAAPHFDAAKIGKLLAGQTPETAGVLPELIKEVKDPYPE
jgi:hypothetical protein